MVNKWADFKSIGIVLFLLTCFARVLLQVLTVVEGLLSFSFGLGNWNVALLLLAIEEYQIPCRDRRFAFIVVPPRCHLPLCGFTGRLCT